MSSEEGVIFDIQRFSVNDGPGIRTTIFMKGCTLRCSWCHNPESISIKQQLRFKTTRCTYCGKCAEVCLSGVHSFSGNIHTVDFPRCILCGKCIEVCCDDALEIVGRKTSVAELIRAVETDRPYYGSSGGVTFSGGEPMMQPAFVIEAAKQLKDLNIHTAVETCGFASAKNYTDILPYSDLFLFDYKITDPDDHIKYTGAERNIILETLDLLASSNKEIILRCPIIKGINDNNRHFHAIADLCSKYASIIDYELMPYHSMGTVKAEQVGMSNRNAAYETAEEIEIGGWKEKISIYMG